MINNIVLISGNATDIREIKQKYNIDVDGDYVYILSDSFKLSDILEKENLIIKIIKYNDDLNLVEFHIKDQYLYLVFLKANNKKNIIRQESALKDTYENLNNSKAIFELIMNKNNGPTYSFYKNTEHIGFNGTIRDINILKNYSNNFTLAHVDEYDNAYVLTYKLNYKVKVNKIFIIFK